MNLGSRSGSSRVFFTCMFTRFRYGKEPNLVRVYGPQGDKRRESFIYESVLSFSASKPLPLRYLISEHCDTRRVGLLTYRLDVALLVQERKVFHLK